MKFVLTFLALFALLILQAGLVGNLGLGKAGNLILLFIVVTVIVSDFEESFFSVLVGGLMLDLVSASRAGTVIISLLVVYGFTYLFINRLVPRELNRFILFSCIVLNTILFAVSFVLVNQFLNILHLDSVVDWKYILGKKLLLDLIVNVVLAYPIYLFYLWLESMQKRLAKII